MPKSVLNGTFTESDHAEPDQKIASPLYGQIENGTSAFAAYQSADRESETSRPVLAVTGVYGTVLSPITARDEFLKILDRRIPDRSSTVIIEDRQAAHPSAWAACVRRRLTASRAPGCQWRLPG
ncbi:hypothetical protein ABZ281_43690 [Streptomyces sp. NPDC006265]|uniref:hypothetical protein n=1 Tax=Streptomyces sp. NPDC006265 TaxID=3156740 RepID=UPI0033AC40A5